MKGSRLSRSNEDGLPSLARNTRLRSKEISQARYQPRSLGPGDKEILAVFGEPGWKAGHQVRAKRRRASSTRPSFALLPGARADRGAEKPRATRCAEPSAQTPRRHPHTVTTTRQMWRGWKLC